MKFTVTSTALILGLSTTVALAEGNLNIYNWGEYISPELIDKFSKTYNVHVTLTDFDSNDTALAKVRQGSSGFDVVVPSQSFIPTYIQEGLLAETNPGQMENAKNLEERWRDPAFDPGRKYSVPWLWYTSGISVNTSVFKGDINTWKVILDPPDELKGKINIVPEMNDIMFAAIKFEGGRWSTSDKALLPKVRDRPLEAKKSWMSIDYSGTLKKASHDSALTAADLIIEGEPACVALCRPPGHHAGTDFNGGYCFVNNAAVASKRLLDAGASRVTILDIDYHHGNGTQEIFYARGDVQVVSLHADPRNDYPFFAGYADERGSGSGEGFNINIPLPHGTDWAQWEGALDFALGSVRQFGPDVVVISHGVDTFEGDPISRFRLSHDHFPLIGARLAGLSPKTLFVLEGGYAVEDVGINVVGVLSGYEDVIRR